MLILVIGGSGSGKSAYAEKRIEELAGSRKKYYLATMAVRDEEMEQKVVRHRRIRAGKSWQTLEFPTDVGTAAESLDHSLSERKIRDRQESDQHAGAAVLLEDLGNLTANEMFRDERCLSAEETAEIIDSGLRRLEDAADVLLIVSNEVFCDGIRYDAGTQEYIRALGVLHRRIAARAAEVTEVVAGIPVSTGGAFSEGERENGSLNSPRYAAKGAAWGIKMEIILGGQAQGKLETAKREYPDYTLAGGEVTEFPSDLAPGRGQCRIILNDAHILIRRMLERGYTNEMILKEFSILEKRTSGLVLIFDEIGCGIVPMDPFERKWREVTGRIMTTLAEKADRVERVVCGIPQILTERS